MNKLQEKQCIDDLIFIYENCNIINNKCIRGILDKVIKSLDDYFSNTPLKFEELEEDMNKVDKNHLQDWYIHSVKERDNPIWTNEHIDELLNDFYVYFKNATNDSHALKFEHLQENMVVWDNREKEYIKIFIINYKEKSFSYESFGIEDIYNWVFEENRFFIRGVVE